MKLENMQLLQATLVLETGLHIGAGDAAMQIGGIDNPVIRNPRTGQPYIPGSSIKGKVRSLLEWRAGVVADTKGEVLSYPVWERLEGEKKALGKPILQLFGLSGGDKLNISQAQDIGPSRLSFWDCELDDKWHDQRLEEKTENQINRIEGVAKHPRLTERVPAGMTFEFRLTLRTLSNDDSDNFLDHLLCGLKLLEWDGLGGNLSRGYGKVRFEQLRLMDNKGNINKELDECFKKVDPFK